MSQTFLFCVFNNGRGSESNVIHLECMKRKYHIQRLLCSVSSTIMCVTDEIWFVYIHYFLRYWFFELVNCFCMSILQSTNTVVRQRFGCVTQIHCVDDKYSNTNLCHRRNLVRLYTLLFEMLIFRTCHFQLFVYVYCAIDKDCCKSTIRVCNSRANTKADAKSCHLK